MDALMYALMAWASAQTGIAPADTLPAVTYTAPEEMVQMQYPDGDGGAAANGVRVVALYDPNEAEIYLPLGFDVRDPVDVSVLLHELVHHMQYEAGVGYACRGEMERVAYEAQGEYLSSVGIDLLEAMEMNGLFLHLVTTCLGDIDG